MTRPTVGLAVLVLLLVLLGAASCAKGRVDLTVDVITDWKPGSDFTRIETEVSRVPFDSAASSEIRQLSYAVAGAEDFVHGVRVADVGEVGTGHRFVRVRLRDAAGVHIAGRTLEATLTRTFAATLLIARSCRDVACPAPAGAPELSECQAGECVDPRCSPSTPEFCGPAPCDENADCPAVSTYCDVALTCGETGHCLCVDDAVVPDAGPDVGIDAPTDTGPSCPTTETACTDGLDDDCDGLTDCADDDCLGAGCADGFYCTTNDRCGGDGACSDTNPTCPMFCNEATSSCEECTANADCGAPGTGAWGSCGGFGADPCNTVGTRSRTVTTPRCDAGTCVVDSSSQTGACSRTTNGAACNDGNACTGPDRCSGGTCSNTPAMAEHSVCGSTNDRCCGGSCVNITTSTAHCGGCGLGCNSGYSCGSRGGLPTCECFNLHSTCSGSTGSCSGSTDLCSCDPTYGGSCPAPMRCYSMSLGADVCTY